MHKKKLFSEFKLQIITSFFCSILSLFYSESVFRSLVKESI